MISSRTFFRLVKVEPPYCHSTSVRQPLGRLLKKDGRCNNCQRWNDANKYVDRWPRDRPCQFGLQLEADGGRLYCNACDTDHEACRFPFADQQPSRHARHRRCLGQLGSVQLCEHVHISWVSIQAHIDGWRQQHPGGCNWGACLDSFHVECRHASHNTCCTDVAPTWPRATLCLGKNDQVNLSLQWNPHCPVDALNLTAEALIPAPEPRDLFRRLRRIGPASILCPGSSHPDALPEMVCVGHVLSKTYVYYDPGPDHRKPPAREPYGSPLRYIHPDEWLPHSFYEDEHRYWRYFGRKVTIRLHYLRRVNLPAINHGCLAVLHEKDIDLCKMADLTCPAARIIPTHTWLHAMDVRTYPHPEIQTTSRTRSSEIVFSQDPKVMPPCQEETCVNYYPRSERHCMMGLRD